MAKISQFKHYDEDIFEGYCYDIQVHFIPSAAYSSDRWQLRIPKNYFKVPVPSLVEGIEPKETTKHYVIYCKDYDDCTTKLYRFLDGLKEIKVEESKYIAIWIKDTTDNYGRKKHGEGLGITSEIFYAVTMTKGNGRKDYKWQDQPHESTEQTKSVFHQDPWKHNKNVTIIDFSDENWQYLLNLQDRLKMMREMVTEKFSSTEQALLTIGEGLLLGPPK